VVLSTLEMGKKRKTRQQKIILQLKRKLAVQQTKETLSPKQLEARQEAIPSKSLSETQKKLSTKKPSNMVFYYDPRLIKRDILKTLILSLALISFQLMLYLRLR